MAMHPSSSGASPRPPETSGRRHTPLESSAASTALASLMASIFAGIQRIAAPFLRLSLGLILLWIGLLKFHDPSPVVGLIHASVVFRFLASSPFVYGLGTLEVLAALLLFANVGVRYVGLGVALLFVGTLSIFLTAPAAVYSPGFPLLSLAGQFLLKDVILLAATLTLVASDAAAHARSAASPGARIRG